jgi:hypothetical protein
MINPIEVGILKLPFPEGVPEEKITGMVPCHVGREDVLFVFTPHYTFKIRRLKWWERLLKWSWGKWGEKIGQFKVEDTRNAR